MKIGDIVKYGSRRWWQTAEVVAVNGNMVRVKRIWPQFPGGRTNRLWYPSSRVEVVVPVRYRGRV